MISMTRKARQTGVTLIELLVGLAIGLMAVAVALGALLVSRGVSGTVSDASQMQQQGAHALRVIGRQLRQAGAIRLNLAFAVAPGSAPQPATIDPLGAVAFERSFDRQSMLGTDVANEIRVGYQNYTESVSFNSEPQSLLADCQGKPSATGVVQSDFVLVMADGATTGVLQCSGVDGVAQTLIGNVADFQVRYMLQTTDATGARVQWTTAAGVTNVEAVVAVEVCLEIVGEESIDSAGATYRNCSWQDTDAELPMGNRMRMVFRNTFQVRTQGAP